MKNLLAKMILPVLLFGAYYAQMSSLTTFVMCLVWVLILAGVCAVFMLSAATTELKTGKDITYFSLKATISKADHLLSSWLFILVNTTMLVVLNYPITAAAYLIMGALVLFGIKELKEQYNKLIQEKAE